MIKKNILMKKISSTIALLTDFGLTGLKLIHTTQAISFLIAVA